MDIYLKIVLVFILFSIIALIHLGEIILNKVFKGGYWDKYINIEARPEIFV